MPHSPHHSSSGGGNTEPRVRLQKQIRVAGRNHSPKIKKFVADCELRARSDPRAVLAGFVPGQDFLDSVQQDLPFGVMCRRRRHPRRPGPGRASQQS